MSLSRRFCLSLLPTCDIVLNRNKVGNSSILGPHRIDVHLLAISLAIFTKVQQLTGPKPTVKNCVPKCFIKCAILHP